MSADLPDRRLALAPLDALVGTWSMEAAFAGVAPSGPIGQTVFEWLPGRQFLIQRWEVPHPDAPDGLAIIGLTESGDEFAQHYFDSRGVARLYAMTLGSGVWTLLRESPDFSPLGFSQRFTGTFGRDGSVINGRWESAGEGSAWTHDFDLTYRKVN